MARTEKQTALRIRPEGKRIVQNSMDEILSDYEKGRKNKGEMYMEEYWRRKTEHDKRNLDHADHLRDIGNDHGDGETKE